eukprot:SAG11_NODE_6045_length_1401_cov_3.483871_2_plen_272_part_00
MTSFKPKHPTISRTTHPFDISSSVFPLSSFTSFTSSDSDSSENLRYSPVRSARMEPVTKNVVRTKRTAHSASQNDVVAGTRKFKKTGTTNMYGNSEKQEPERRIEICFSSEPVIHIRTKGGVPQHDTNDYITQHSCYMLQARPITITNTQPIADDIDNTDDTVDTDIIHGDMIQETKTVTLAMASTEREPTPRGSSRTNSPASMEVDEITTRRRLDFEQSARKRARERLNLTESEFDEYLKTATPSKIDGGARPYGKMIPLPFTMGFSGLP